MLNLLSDSIKSCFKISPGTNVIITAGNSIRSDDGVGPYIAYQIKNNKNFVVIDAGYAPENIIDRAIELSPKKIIFIDAADFKGLPGEIRLIDKGSIPESSLSTHAIPLKVIYEIIAKDTKAEVYFIGIQPKTVETGEDLSLEIKTSADEIIKFINRGE